MAAFDRALEQGWDGFECDVRLTACGRALVCHDAKVDGILVSHATRAQLPHPPQMEDVVCRFGARGFLDIELKVRGLETRVLSALRDPSTGAGLCGVFIPARCRPGTESAQRNRSRGHHLWQKPASSWHWRKLPVEYVIVHQSLVTRRLVQVIQEVGRKIFVWTVNDKSPCCGLPAGAWMPSFPTGRNLRGFLATSPGF